MAIMDGLVTEAQNGAENSKDPKKVERQRLIDHFKRAYQIIVGLAITNACLKFLHPEHLRSFWEFPEFWMFCAFFVTVVPIFHGGDRSLDVRYLNAKVTRAVEKFWYVFDVFMLLVTAVCFVKIAQALPGKNILQHTEGSAALFYGWMSFMFFFDAIVLVIGYFRVVRESKKPGGVVVGEAHGWWIMANLISALLFLLACSGKGVFLGLDGVTVAVAIFGAALLRTAFDYWKGGEFMFP